MFRISAQEKHVWQDIVKNFGKLSLAGVFVGGTLFMAHAYAELPQTDRSSAMSAWDCPAVCKTIMK